MPGQPRRSRGGNARAPAPAPTPPAAGSSPGSASASGAASGSDSSRRGSGASPGSGPGSSRLLRRLSRSWPPAPPREPPTPPPPVGMKEALIVVGDADNTAGTGDEVLEQFMFDDLEFFVTIADDEDDSAEFGRNIGLVVISSSVDQNHMLDEYLISPFPVIVMDDAILEEMQMVEENDGDVENDQEIEIQDGNHPIVPRSALSEEEVEVYNNNNDLIFGEPAGDADIVATNAGDNDEATIFVYEAGAELAEDDDNNTRHGAQPPRRVLRHRGSPQRRRPERDGEALLEAAILYTWNGTVQ